MSSKDFQNYALAVRDAYEHYTTTEPGMVFHIKMSSDFVKYLKNQWDNLIYQENMRNDCNYIDKQDDSTNYSHLLPTNVKTILISN